MARASQFPKESAYRNAYALPSVNQMFTCGGAGYNDPRTMPRIFPVGPQARLQTPINNVGAFLFRHRPRVAFGARGRMWCR